MYKNAFDCFLKIIRKEGPLAVYKGFTSPLYSLTLINGIIFAVYGSTIRYTSNPEALSSHFIAGSVAGNILLSISVDILLALADMIVFVLTLTAISTCTDPNSVEVESSCV